MSSRFIFVEDNRNFHLRAKQSENCDICITRVRRCRACRRSLPHRLVPKTKRNSPTEFTNRTTFPFRNLRRAYVYIRNLSQPIPGTQLNTPLRHSVPIKVAISYKELQIARRNNARVESGMGVRGKTENKTFVE